MPLGAATAAADGLAAALWVCAPGRAKRRLLGSIGIGMPELGAAGSRRVARANLRSLLRAAVHCGQTGRIVEHEQKAETGALRYDIPPEIAPLFARQTIWVTGHFSGWELAGYFISLRSRHPVHTVARAVGKPAFNRFLMARRAAPKHRLDETPVSRLWQRGGEEEDLRGFMRAVLREGGSAMLVADQRKLDGVRVRLLGHEVLFNEDPVRIALRTGAPIALFRSVPHSYAAYAVEFGPVLRPALAPGQEKEEVVRLCTQQIADWLGEEIRRRPETWLWQRSRWKL